jgi:tetratricopeptide (TPR) repeat protein
MLRDHDATSRWLTAVMAAATLLTMALPRRAFTEPTPSTAHSASIRASLPELQRLQQRADWAGLEQLSRQALSDLQAQLGSESTDLAAADNWLALALWREGRYAEAEPLHKRALAIDENALGPKHPGTARTQERLAFNDEFHAKFNDATMNYRLACTTLLSIGRSRDLSGHAAHVAQRKSNDCSTRLSLSLWSWSAQGGGAAAKRGGVSHPPPA